MGIGKERGNHGTDVVATNAIISFTMAHTPFAPEMDFIPSIVAILI